MPKMVGWCFLMTVKFYMAHPWGARETIRKWQLEFEERTNIKLINPFYEGDVDGIEAPSKVSCPIDHVNVLKWAETCDYRGIIEKDLKHIIESDGVIAYIDGSTSYGTIMEIVYARILGKMVLIVCTNGYESHPWLRYHVHEIFTSLEELEKYLE